jgi:hypothetical protein
VFTLLLLLAAAQEKPAAPGDAPAPVAKKVCRSEQVVGSRIPSSRTCRTPAEWVLIDRGRADRSLDLVRRDQVR